MFILYPNPAPTAIINGITILITDGAGYIGTPTAVELINAGYDVIVVGILPNSSEEVLRRVEKITGKTHSIF